MLDHRKNFYLRKNVPKRCLSVHLCNIHQSWILMSILTEKGTESILLRNKNTQKNPPQMCQIVHDRPRISCRCEQTLTWMSGCQSAARRKSLPLCSCVQLSPRKKNDIYSTPCGCRKYPRRQAWEETGILSTNGKHWGSTSINQLKVKDLHSAQMVLGGQLNRDTARDCAKICRNVWS